jgi:molybdopterin synthase catalytic subunit
VKDPIIVSGLSPEPLDVARLVDEIRRRDCGGLVVFEGTARTPSEDKEVLRLEYEAYEVKVEHQLLAFAEEAADRFGLGGVVAVHRIGDVGLGMPAVVAAASAPHRAEAFEGARWLIDTIKADAYIWKKEVFAEGGSWVGIDARR